MKFIQVIGNFYRDTNKIEILKDFGFVNLDRMEYFSVGIEKIKDLYFVLLYTEQTSEDGSCDWWITGRYQNKADAILGTQNILNKITGEIPTSKSFKYISKHFCVEEMP